MIVFAVSNGLSGHWWVHGLGENLIFLDYRSIDEGGFGRIFTWCVLQRSLSPLSWSSSLTAAAVSKKTQTFARIFSGHMIHQIEAKAWRTYWRLVRYQQHFLWPWQCRHHHRSSCERTLYWSSLPQATTALDCIPELANTQACIIYPIKFGLVKLPTLNWCCNCRIVSAPCQLFCCVGHFQSYLLQGNPIYWSKWPFVVVSCEPGAKLGHN